MIHPFVSFDFNTLFKKKVNLKMTKTNLPKIPLMF